MKTLIINGSPRKNGDTAYFTNKIMDNIESCDIINAYFCDFSPCCDCRNCFEGDCIYNDEVTRLLSHIEEYDNIVVATPLYFNQPTGMLMSLMSRTQIFFNKGIKLREKRGFVIVVGGGDSVINSADCEKTIRIMLRGLNVKVQDYVRCLYTSRVKPSQDEMANEQLNKMIESMKKGIVK